MSPTVDEVIAIVLKGWDFDDPQDGSNRDIWVIETATRMARAGHTVGEIEEALRKGPQTSMDGMSYSVYRTKDKAEGSTETWTCLEGITQVKGTGMTPNEALDRCQCRVQDAFGIRAPRQAPIIELTPEIIFREARRHLEKGVDLLPEKFKEDFKDQVTVVRDLYRMMSK